MANSPALLKAATADTSNSGAEVPKATTVIPIKIKDILQCFAKVADAEMSLSALNDRITKPNDNAKDGSKKVVIT
jgi:hypothetical protein